MDKIGGGPAQGPPPTCASYFPHIFHYFAYFHRSVLSVDRQSQPRFPIPKRAPLGAGSGPGGAVKPSEKNRPRAHPGPRKRSETPGPTPKVRKNRDPK